MPWKSLGLREIMGCFFLYLTVLFKFFLKERLSPASNYTHTTHYTHTAHTHWGYVCMHVYMCVYNPVSIGAHKHWFRKTKQPLSQIRAPNMCSVQTVNINTIMTILNIQPEVSTPGFWKKANCWSVSGCLHNSVNSCFPYKRKKGTRSC